nr:hypothetical protein [Methylocapsa sp. RX1]
MFGCCVLALAGCGSKEDASEANFGAAISSFLTETGDLCLGFNIRQWPIDVAPGSLLASGQLEALEAAGLVSSEPAAVDEKNIFGKPTGFRTAVKRYQLSDKGKTFYRELSRSGLFANAGEIKGGDFCYGKEALDKVVKWEGPTKPGADQQVRVTYSYKINDLADWAKAPSIASAFPREAQILAGAGKQNWKVIVKLTSAGWEVVSGH